MFVEELEDEDESEDDLEAEEPEEESDSDASLSTASPPTIEIIPQPTKRLKKLKVGTLLSLCR